LLPLKTALALATPTVRQPQFRSSSPTMTAAAFGQSSVTIPAKFAGGCVPRPGAMFTPNPFSTRPISAAQMFTFTASLPISAMAARTGFNERGEMHVDSTPRRRRDRFNFSIVGSFGR